MGGRVMDGLVRVVHQVLGVRVGQDLLQKVEMQGGEVRRLALEAFLDEDRGLAELRLQAQERRRVDLERGVERLEKLRDHAEISHRFLGDAAGDLRELRVGIPVLLLPQQGVLHREFRALLLGGRRRLLRRDPRRQRLERLRVAEPVHLVPRVRQRVARGHRQLLQVVLRGREDELLAAQVAAVARAAARAHRAVPARGHVDRGEQRGEARGGLAEARGAPEGLAVEAADAGVVGEGAAVAALREGEAGAVCGQLDEEAEGLDAPRGLCDLDELGEDGLAELQDGVQRGVGGGEAEDPVAEGVEVDEVGALVEEGGEGVDEGEEEAHAAPGGGVVVEGAALGGDAGVLGEVEGGLEDEPEGHVGGGEGVDEVPGVGGAEPEEEGGGVHDHPLLEEELDGDGGAGDGVDGLADDADVGVGGGGGGEVVHAVAGVGGGGELVEAEVAEEEDGLIGGEALEGEVPELRGGDPVPRKRLALLWNINALKRSW